MPSTDFAEYEEPYSVGDKVVITAGDMQGHIGVVACFITDGDNCPDILIQLDSNPWAYVRVLASMVRHARPAAPEVPDHGMTSAQLAKATGEFIAFCQDRITGVGNDQYSTDTHQKFEAMELDELIEYALEELADQANYATMLYIRFRRIQQALGEYL